MRRNNWGKMHLDILTAIFLLSIIISIIAPRFLRLEVDAYRANSKGAAAELGTHIRAINDAQNGKAGKIFIGSFGVVTGDNGWPVAMIFKDKKIFFEKSLLGNKACHDLFVALMPETDLQVSTMEDPHKDADYMAVGEENGCMYIYREATPKKGEAYVLHYDMHTGVVAATEEVVP